MGRTNIEQIAEQILEMRPAETDQVLQLLVRQWERAFPDYALLLTSVPKNDPQEQKRILEFAFRMIDEQANT